MFRLWTVSELVPLVAIVAVLGLVVASLLGEPTPLSEVPGWLRLVGAAFLVGELLIPALVFFDLRRRSEVRRRFWVRVAAMPGIDVFGLVNSLVDRWEARRT